MDNRTVRTSKRRGREKRAKRETRALALMEAVEGRVFLCAMHPGLNPNTHDPFVGPFVPGDPAAAESVSWDETLAASMPVGTPTQPSGLPILNSLPSAPADIYLDFDGDSASSRTPYDEDGNSAAYSATEQANIYEAWRQVSQYFAIFDVNVTTVFTQSRPKAWEVISNSHTGVGFSFVNVFPNSKPESFNPPGDARGRQSGIAHEVGHNFGLAHQSTYDAFGEKINEYAGASDPLHGHIMGVDYAGKVHKWSIGHPSGSPSSVQDDIQVIASDIRARQAPGGDGFRADDYPNTIATALALPVDSAGTTYKADGIIERLNDADAFSFVAGGGNVAIDATPVFPSGADLRLDVYDADGDRLATADASDTNFQTLNLDLAAGSYYAVVSSHGNYGDVGSYTFGVRDLPEGWVSDDIGVVGWGGFTEYDPATGAFTHAGSGEDVWGGNDEMRFTYQTLTGDATIVARVTEIPNTHAWAKVGVDIRESLNTNARHAGMVMSHGNGPQFLWRSSVGGSTSGINNHTGTAFSPRWVKLERVGNTFRGYVSNDGIAWTQYGSATVSMGQKVFIGLLNNSQGNTKLNVAKMDNVTVTGELGVTAPVYNALPSPANVAVTPGLGTALSVTWDAVEGANGYRIEQSSDGVTFGNVGQVGAGVTNFSSATLAGSVRYYYRVSTLDDLGGASAPSVAISGANRPSAVTSLAVTSWRTNAVILNWRDTDGETGYRVERSSDGVNFSGLSTVGPNVPSYTDNSVSEGATYTYRVIPLSAQGDGATATTTGGPRLAAVGGLQFVEVASNRIAFRWNDLTTETGYKIERSLDGDTWTALTNVGAGVTQYSDTTVQPMREYYYRVMGMAGQALGMFPTPLIAATPAATPLPAPWVGADVGTVPGRGASSSSSPTTFNILSIGDNMSGTTDQFHFTYQSITGDAQIIARVASIEATDDAAKAGVMIREGLTNNSKHASMFISSDDGVTMAYRTTTGGQSASTAGSTTATAPIWLRLTRTGTTLRGSTSSDGVNWTDVGTVTISMNATVYVGLAASSYDVTKLGSSSFTNVAVSPPRVLSSTFERPDRLSVTFSGDVGASLAAGDLLIESVPAATSTVATSVSWNAATRTATFRLPGLADGNYRARLAGAGVRDGANYGLLPDWTFDFFALTGDANADRTVNHLDFGVLFANLAPSGRVYTQGDFNLDGAVDFKDFQILERAFGKTLPAPAAELLEASAPPASSIAGETGDEDLLRKPPFSRTPIRPTAVAKKPPVRRPIVARN